MNPVSLILPVVRQRLTLAAVLVLFASVTTVRSEEAVAGGGGAIGVAARAFADPERLNWPGTGPRSVRTTLWYPCDAGGTRELVDDHERSPRLALWRDAPVASARERYPLILLSHGSGGNAAQVSWLGHHLAGQGFMVAAVDHNGTPEEEGHFQRPTLTDFLAWERARDLSVALTELLTDPVLGPRIDSARIGAAGFSLGGTTALWTAGARLDLDALHRNGPPPPPEIAAAIDQLIAYSETDPVARASVARANHSYRDTRIRAVFAIAPPMGAGFTAEGLRDVTVPVAIVAGDADLIAPPATNARHFARHIPQAQLSVLPGEAGHFTDATPPARRPAELRTIAAMAGRFFAEQLN